MRKVLTAMLGIILFASTISAQVDSAYTVKNGSLCNGQNPTGAWRTASTWAATGGLSRPPIGNWAGTKIVIKNNIIICNNNNIDLSGSNVNKVILRSGSSIAYNANSTLIFPTNTIIIMEANTSISVSNQSQGTLLQIGNDSIWGKEIRCTIQIDGPRTINNQTRICEESLLPVELGSCKAIESENKINLEWATLSEINSSHFEIYRSKDAVHWDDIGAEKAAGWSDGISTYSWMDGLPPYTINYYRIKQVDIDGAFEWFPIVSAKINQPIKSVLNNPIDNILHLSLNIEPNPFKNKEVKLVFLDANGTEKHSTYVTIEEHKNNYALDLANLGKGVYFIFLESENDFAFVDKLVKM